ncbi:hypothetical protein BDD26_1939 [Xenorhabdus cabanillasii]|uniref:Uncharacterized protein n=1 Tax=Xenorhabdus cabanillasii TaxID=351673 RepID=A0A3D9UCI9_9GAMM|nr:hypothetical protein [Xenorhabdus cabanillasii]REF27192.1 hypothetical protein BDD26_1939 [Xenorhabdus cabanillasii]
MTEDEQTLLMFRGLVTSLTEQQKQNFEHCITVLNQLLDDYPDGEALIALGYIGAEQQMKRQWGNGK